MIDDDTEQNPLATDPFFQKKTGQSPAENNKPDDLSSDPFFSHQLPLSLTRPTGTQSVAIHDDIPTPAPKVDYGSMSAGDVLKSGIKTFPKAALDILGQYKNAVMHPVQTVGNIGNLISGAGSQLAGAIGMPQDQKQKAENEESINALEDKYSKKYGSVAGFKEAAATNLPDLLMDLSVPLTGGETAFGKVPGILGKTARYAGTAGTMMDPIQLAVATAKTATKVPIYLGKKTQSILANVPYEAIDTATKVLNGADKNQRNAFFSSTPVSDINSVAQRGLKSITDDNVNEHLTKKLNLSPNTPGLVNDFTPLNTALQSSWDKVKPYSTGTLPFPEANKAWHEVSDLVQEHIDDPNLQTLSKMDDLRNAIYNIRLKYSDNPQALNVIDKAYAALKDTVDKKAPGYIDLLQEGQDRMGEVKDLTTSLGLGKRGTASAAVTKMISKWKTPQGKNLLDALAEKEPTLPYLLAGASLSELFPQDFWHGLVGSGALMGAVTNPAYALHFAGGVLASSPKVAGYTNLALGAGQNIAGKTIAPAFSLPAQRAAYYSQLANKNPQEEQKNAPSNTPEGFFYNKMLPVESSTGQFMPNGETVYSPKGAAGAAQIMKGTGPEAAQLAGEVWDPERLKTDTEYNKKLGLAYFEEQFRKFGDPYKAAAAYNAGASRVQNAIKAAAATGDDWTNHLPPETKEYLRRIYLRGAATGGRIGRASGGRIMNHRSEADNLIRLADKTKKALNNSTESLLAVPDEAVTKALSIANEAI